MDKGIEEGIEGRRLGIDKDLGLGPRGVDEPGRRIHPEARPGDDENLTLLEGVFGSAKGLVVELFPVKNDVGSDDAAAFRAARNAMVGDFLERIGGPAGEAMVAKDRAMELHHVFRAGLLVEAVDVLGNDVDWARVMGDRPMSRVRLGLVMDEEVPIEIEEEASYTVCGNP